MTDSIKMLPPYCPFCHKAFVGAGLSVKTCHCKKGQKLFTDWIEEQRKAMDNLTNPNDILIAEDISLEDTITPS